MGRKKKVWSTRLVVRTEVALVRLPKSFCRLGGGCRWRKKKFKVRSAKNLLIDRDKAMLGWPTGEDDGRRGARWPLMENCR